MVAKDERLLLLTESLRGARALKLHAWEVPFLRRLAGSRAREVACLKKAAYVWSAMVLSITLCPVLVTLVMREEYELESYVQPSFLRFRSPPTCTSIRSRTA